MGRSHRKGFEVLKNHLRAGGGQAIEKKKLKRGTTCGWSPLGLNSEGKLKASRRMRQHGWETRVATDQMCRDQPEGLGGSTFRGGEKMCSG